jgi:hypothetical protein
VHICVSTCGPERHDAQHSVWLPQLRTPCTVCTALHAPPGCPLRHNRQL